MSKNEEAVHLFNRLAIHYQNRYMDVSAYSNGLDYFCDKISDNASVLELACGPGNISKYILQRKPCIDFLGTDLSPNMIRLAKQNCSGAMFHVQDSRDFTNITKKYDGIICGFLLPYLNRLEVEHLINDIYVSLKDNGHLYLSTIEDLNENSKIETGSTGDQLYMNYYELNFLNDLLIKTGFIVEQTELIPIKDSTTTLPRDIVFLARK